MKRFTAFTLSEVLVTLGIIGVVSALTIPTLMKNHQRQINAIQLKKVYSELSQAFKEEITESKTVSLIEAGTFYGGNKNKVKGFFSNHFSKSKLCDTFKECFPASYKRLDGVPVSLSYSDVACAVLADGAAVCIRYFMDGSDDTWKIIIDTNGKQGPNIIARDFFVAKVTMFGEVLSESEFGHDSEINENTALSRIIQDGWEMNY